MILVIAAFGISTYTISRIVIYIQTLRGKLKELEKEHRDKNKQIARKNMEIEFLKKRLHPRKRNIHDKIVQEAERIDSENPEHFKFLLEVLWEMENRNYLKTESE